MNVFLYPFQMPNLGRSQIAMVDLFRENSQRLNPLSASFVLIKNSQMICTTNQLTGFCMRTTLALNGLTIFAKKTPSKIFDSI